ncbi:MAG: single-stranded DNA-binding protein [Bacteroidetes bacterium]|jgi:single-strand DNA-binding protein|nr:single-stranded DNA-binding protein [Bacteroidota bacterium]
MKSLINSVRLIGNVGATPEVKSFDNGNKVARLRIATNDRQKNAKGEVVEITYWHSLVVWGKQAEIIEKYVDKGEKLAIEGTLVNREYLNDKGEKKFITEIRVNEFEFLGAKKNNQEPINSMAEVMEDGLPF